MARSDERGVALVMALLMVLAVSIITSSLLAVARTEAFSSLSYTSMSQVRYGAESGIHAAANHLLYGYAPPTDASATDPMLNYNPAVSPVTYNGSPVILSSDPDIPSNYPSAAARAEFIAASQGALNVNTASVGYTARATLMSMRVLTDYYTGLPVTLQTWEIVGIGRVTGSGAAQVEVSSILERQAVPVFSYAAFATWPGCNALSFAGGATTASYDSAAPLVGGAPVIAQSDGNVGTNGNLDGIGDPTTLYGTLSTPRAGVGNCTTNNVTASTISGWGTVEDGLVTLPQPINPPTPPPISPPPPTTNVMFNAGGCPTGAAFCSGGGGNYTISPPSSSTIVSMGNVSLNGGSTIHLNAGIYEINSLTLTGSAHIVIDSGPVIIKVAGQGQTTPIDLSGGGVSNPSLDPTQLQFIYGGTGDIKITGGSQSAALVYAPNATTSLGGSSVDFYGSILTGKVGATGGFNINYDRRLQNTVLTAGNPTMTSFNWRTF
jgi:hypothetical protein